MSERCPDHPEITMLHFCPKCRGTRGGQSRSEYKVSAAKENIQKVKRRGWPKGKKRARTP